MTRIVWVILRKELRELRQHRASLFALVGMPILAAIIGVAYLAVLHGFAEEGAVPDSVARGCGGLADADCFVTWLGLMLQAVFLAFPGVIPATAGAQALVGEKVARTLEPLLATPVTTVELLLAKGLAACLPPIVANQFAWGLWLLGMGQIDPSIPAVLASSAWCVAILLLGPLLSVASTLLALIVSSRVTEPRTAQQVTALVVAPAVGLITMGISGATTSGSAPLLWMALAIAVVDGVLAMVAVRLFDREAILTRWR